MNDNSRIMAQLEFDVAYRAYTEASKRVYDAVTQEQRKNEQDQFEKASERFSQAYLRLKQAQNEPWSDKFKTICMFLQMVFLYHFLCLSKVSHIFWQFP